MEQAPIGPLIRSALRGTHGGADRVGRRAARAFVSSISINARPSPTRDRKPQTERIVQRRCMPVWPFWKIPCSRQCTRHERIRCDGPRTLERVLVSACELQDGRS
eukprot:2688561-Rhodomonas_salina.1